MQTVTGENRSQCDVIYASDKSEINLSLHLPPNTRYIITHNVNINTKKVLKKNVFNLILRCYIHQQLHNLFKKCQTSHTIIKFMIISKFIALHYFKCNNIKLCKRINNKQWNEDIARVTIRNDKVEVYVITLLFDVTDITYSI